MRIIPAIDIIDGKCVRLSKGDYGTKKIYNENPLEVAKEFEAHGIEYLHLVDLDGAKSKHIVNHKVLEQIASKTTLKIDFGGGLKTDDDLRIAFESGAGQITGGSIAVKDKDTFVGWLEKYGADKIILGADAMNEKVAVSGWQEGSSEELLPFIKSYQEKGIQYVICTDIAKDGMLEGPSFDLYRKIIEMSDRASRRRLPTDGADRPVDEEVPSGDKADQSVDEADRPVDTAGSEQVQSRAADLGTAPASQRNGHDTASKLKLIASGGISTFNELPKLAEIGCEGTIIGKAIYENRISLKQLEEFIVQKSR